MQQHLPRVVPPLGDAWLRGALFVSLCAYVWAGGKGTLLVFRGTMVRRDICSQEGYLVPKLQHGPTKPFKGTNSGREFKKVPWVLSWMRAWLLSTLQVWTLAAEVGRLVGAESSCIEGMFLIQPLPVAINTARAWQVALWWMHFLHWELSLSLQVLQRLQLVKGRLKALQPSHSSIGAVQTTRCQCVDFCAGASLSDVIPSSARRLIALQVLGLKEKGGAIFSAWINSCTDYYRLWVRP